MKPSIPQGTRDFGPEVVKKRNYIFRTIQAVFELYGFAPLETPALENLDTLMGKYGDEGDKLIFKILNNGLNDPKNIQKAQLAFANVTEGKNDKNLTERALRYDLTIPFARYVAMNIGQLTLPFKRFQMQPVWRADRPQKGRYREFYQCDADIVGSKSLLNEVELVNIYSTVFQQLGIDVSIRINSRKILTALAEVCGGLEKLTDITVAIDKLDKIGVQKVKEELLSKNLSESQIAIIEQYLQISGNNQTQLACLTQLLGNSEIGQKGIEEINFILNFHQNNSALTVDFTLARGLNYYTGVIFEVKANDVQMGSIGGGGRYDDLTGLFGVPNIPGVGISFGVDRIYDVMEERALFPTTISIGTEVLFFNLGDAECKTAYHLMQLLRNKGISCEIYHENTKFDKQFKYAEKKSIPYVVMIGSKEITEGTCIIKHLPTSTQVTLPQAEMTNYAFQ